MLLDLAPLTLDAGADVAAAAQQLYSLLDARAAAGDGVSDRAQVRIGLAASPLTDAFSGASGVELDDAVALATAAAARTETVRALMVDGTAFHNAGAGDAEELGAAIAAGVEYLRALTAQGLTISRPWASSSSVSPRPTTSSRPSRSSGPAARFGRASRRCAAPPSSVAQCSTRSPPPR